MPVFLGVLVALAVFWLMAAPFNSADKHISRIARAVWDKSDMGARRAITIVLWIWLMIGAFIAFPARVAIWVDLAIVLFGLAIGDITAKVGVAKER